PIRALPTTVLPVLPSLRDRLSNRWKDLLYCVAFAAANLRCCQRRDVIGLELPAVCGVVADTNFAHLPTLGGPIQIVNKLTGRRIFGGRSPPNNWRTTDTPSEHCFGDLS